MFRFVCINNENISSVTDFLSFIQANDIVSFSVAINKCQIATNSLAIILLYLC